MNMPVLTCVHCGAKLKIKPATLRFIKEVPCAKCLKKFTVTDAMKSEAAAAADFPSEAAIPSAPRPASATTVIPEFAPTPVPMQASIPVAVAAAVATPASASAAPDAALAAKVDALDARMQMIEATILALRDALT